MFDTLVEATFIYRNHVVKARRLVDTGNNKTFGWYGEFDLTNSVARPTLEEFEQAFRDIVDKKLYTESYTS